MLALSQMLQPTPLSAPLQRLFHQPVMLAPYVQYRMERGGESQREHNVFGRSEEASKSALQWNESAIDDMGRNRLRYTGHETYP